MVVVGGLWVLWLCSGRAVCCESRGGGVALVEECGRRGALVDPRGPPGAGASGRAVTRGSALGSADGTAQGGCHCWNRCLLPYSPPTLECSGSCIECQGSETSAVAEKQRMRHTERGATVPGRFGRRIDDAAPPLRISPCRQAHGSQSGLPCPRVDRVSSNRVR